MARDLWSPHTLLAALEEYLPGPASASLPSLKVSFYFLKAQGLEQVIEPPWKLGNWVGPHLLPAAVNRPWGAEAEGHAGSGQGSGL